MMTTGQQNVTVGVDNAFPTGSYSPPGSYNFPMGGYSPPQTYSAPPVMGVREPWARSMMGPTMTMGPVSMPNYAVPTAPQLPPSTEPLSSRQGPAGGGKSFEKWPEAVTSEDFQIQALEREALRLQEKHLEQRLRMMEKLIRPRPIDDQANWKYTGDRKFSKLCFPHEVGDPNYDNTFTRSDRHTFYIQKDKVFGREHQLAEFYRRLEKHPIIYSLAGIRGVAKQDFIEAATQREWLEKGLER